MEAKLQKLKVPELKELLTKHNLPTTGKKEELIQRLLPVEQEAEEDSEQLLEPPSESAAAPEQQTEATNGASESVDAPPAATEETAEPAALSPEEEARRKRAARFGIPYDPNAPAKTSAPKSKGKAAAAEPTADVDAKSTAAPASNKREKISADGVKSLGISEELLAKRAAKFGPVDVKPAPKEAAVPQEKKEAVASSEKKEEVKAAEVDPATAQRLQEEEEKKRKRAEKFGTAAEPADKKAKVQGE